MYHQPGTALGSTQTAQDGKWDARYVEDFGVYYGDFPKIYVTECHPSPPGKFRPFLFCSKKTIFLRFLLW
jgi:hypothetical protein